MNATLAEPRAEMSKYAPRIITVKINPEKIGGLIGPGGKNIKRIVEESGCEINIEDDGTVKIASSNAKEIEAAKKWIHTIVAEPEVGEIYEGTVVKTADFGAFVNFFGPKDGLVHISHLAPQRVNKVTDVVKEGDKVKVKLLGFDERGKVRLSMKAVDQKTGEDLEAKQKAEPAGAAE
jgi:polyribonucleotide nucleotidyltransferase